MKLLMKVLSVLFIAIFFYLGFSTPSEPCGVDGGAMLYCNLHPLKMWDILGIILFSVGALSFGGWFNALYEKEEENGSMDVNMARWASAVVIVVGWLLTLL